MNPQRKFRMRDGCHGDHANVEGVAVKGVGGNHQCRTLLVQAGNRRQTGRFLVLFLPMARLARVVGVDVAHHMTQRGNGGEFVLAVEAERIVYLDLLRQAVQTACPQPSPDVRDV